MDRNNIDINELLGGGALQIPSSSSSSSNSNASGHASVSSNSMDGSENSMSMDSSSESEEESEDEENVMMMAAYDELLFGAPRSRVDNFLEVAREKEDEEFRQDFRLHRPVAYDLIGSLEASGFIPDHPGGIEKKSAELSFLLFLWVVSSDSVHRDAANLFGCGTSTVFRIVRRVTEWLLNILPEHVVWPRGPRIAQTSAAFSGRAEINNVIGAIDGSHMFIEKPINYGRAYWCRKERYSILLQAVVDFNMLFTNLHCGDPGSFHDTRVLRRSQLFQLAENNVQDLFPNETFLLGDKGYVGVGTRWIVTPFKDYGNLTPEQIDFNVRVSSTRVVVEQAFGLLKARFRYLRGIMRLRDLPFAASLVIACCVLHNVCMRTGDRAEDFVVDGREGADNPDDEEVENVLYFSDDEDANGDRVLDDNDEDDQVDEVNDDIRRTLIVFRQLYPGAVLPPRPANRRRRNNVPGAAVP